ncbi:MAG: peptide deformylase [Verrucomicrobia bacterium]|nr:peptide deformylase [Verrucomicrobiota bacterium]
MLLPIVKYGHPALRQKGTRIERITPEIETLIRDMIDTMHDAHGVGLAAQQVAQALQLTVLDVREVTDRPSTLELDGQPADVDTFMPLVLVNPEFKPVGAPVTGPEGCLSFPELYADITRPESIDVTAQNEKGQTIQFRCGGLLAKAIQHEWDHLQGILFIDRMTLETKNKLKPELDELMAETRAELQKKK